MLLFAAHSFYFFFTLPLSFSLYSSLTHSVSRVHKLARVLPYRGSSIIIPLFKIVSPLLTTIQRQRVSAFHPITLFSLLKLNSERLLMRGKKTLLHVLGCGRKLPHYTDQIGMGKGKLHCLSFIMNIGE